MGTKTASNYRSFATFPGLLIMELGMGFAGGAVSKRKEPPRYIVTVDRGPSAIRRLISKVFQPKLRTAACAVASPREDLYSLDEQTFEVAAAPTKGPDRQFPEGMQREPLGWSSASITNARPQSKLKSAIGRIFCQI